MKVVGNLPKGFVDFRKRKNNKFAENSEIN
jgi:hypothetical protein